MAPSWPRPITGARSCRKCWCGAGGSMWCARARPSRKAWRWSGCRAGSAPRTGADEPPPALGAGALAGASGAGRTGALVGVLAGPGHCRGVFASGAERRAAPAGGLGPLGRALRAGGRARMVGLAGREAVPPARAGCRRPPGRAGKRPPAPPAGQPGRPSGGGGAGGAGALGRASGPDFPADSPLAGRLAGRRHAGAGPLGPAHPDAGLPGGGVRPCRRRGRRPARAGAGAIFRGGARNGPGLRRYVDRAAGLYRAADPVRQSRRSGLRAARGKHGPCAHCGSRRGGDACRGAGQRGPGAFGRRCGRQHDDPGGRTHRPVRRRPGTGGLAGRGGSRQPALRPL